MTSPGSNPVPSRLTRAQQAGWGASPWSTSVKLRMALWRTVWLLLFRPTPKPLNAWRLFLLRLFGCRMTGRPFVYSSAIIRMPWHLTLEDKAAVGTSAELYNLGHITLRARCTVAQHAYLCTGTHDLTDPALPLVTGPIEIGPDAFVGVRALILPGVVVGAGAVVGAGSVVTRDVPPWTIGAGNPWRAIRPRRFPGAPAEAAGPAAASPAPAGASRPA